MKTSNVLLLTALLLVIGFLATYNLALLAEYRQGSYKDPYARFTALNLRDFNTIEVNAASKMGIKIMQGPYQVRVFNDLAKVIKIKQSGKTLTVDLDLPEEDQLYGVPYHVVISCPTVNALRTKAVYQVAGKTRTDTKIPEPYLNFNTLVEGFTQDSLNLQLDNSGVVNLTSNKLQKLTAQLGVSAGSTNTLAIAKSNLLPQVTIDMRHKSELVLTDIQIPEFNYQFSDSSKVTCSGAALSIFKTAGK
jgi:hypothetical protein